MSESESFRDRPINIDITGRRKWIYAKNPRGKWFRWRLIVAILLLAFFVIAPIIKINGEPFMLLDIIHRKFILFGAIFWAQDTFILALLMLSFILFITLFTVTYGRLWCGFACPQTIFLEIIFRKIEFLIEGDYKKRFELDEAPLSFSKFLKKVTKHIIFFLVSLLITNTFLLWFIGPDELIKLISDPVQYHLQGFIIMIVISATIYWIYAFFREQICTMVCPYGRMQGVLVDKRSIIVAYDYKRGEPRGKRDGGDCVNCLHCLSVCPTGIDIRNGTQLECINCTACIDECDSVMQKVKRPKGLIRFDSIDGIENGHKTIWNARNKAYSVVLVLLIGFFIFSLTTRSEIEASILKTSGSLYQIQENGEITNIYNLKIINKTHNNMPLELRLLSHKGEIQLAGKGIILKDHESFETVFLLTIPKDQLNSGANTIEFGIYNDEKLVEKYSTSFPAP